MQPVIVKKQNEPNAFVLTRAGPRGAAGCGDPHQRFAALHLPAKEASNKKRRREPRAHRAVAMRLRIGAICRDDMTVRGLEAGLPDAHGGLCS
jgi:hypothetical protein